MILAIASVAAAISLYVFGVAWFQARGSSLLNASDLYLPRTIDVVVVVWLFWVGSSIGSFLNVVAWRLPRGEGVNGRSYCPRCHTQLKARDNFPVFGWLALSGRCRTCRLPISARYPIVEATVGASLTVVGVFELYRLSLPNQSIHWHGGPFWAPVVDWPMMLTLLYHSVALSVAWAFGLIRIEGNRLPSRLMMFAMAATILPMLAYPTLMVVPWQVVLPDHWQPDGLYIDAVMRVVTALVAAVFMGRCLAPGLCPNADPKLDPLGHRTVRLIDLIAVISIPAIVVGWQASPGVVVFASWMAMVLRPMLPSSSDALGRLAIAMPIAMTLQIAFWRTLQETWFWPGVGSSPWVLLAAAGVLFLVPLWLHENYCDGRGRS